MKRQFGSSADLKQTSSFSDLQSISDHSGMFRQHPQGSMLNLQKTQLAKKQKETGLKNKLIALQVDLKKLEKVPGETLPALLEEIITLQTEMQYFYGMLEEFQKREFAQELFLPTLNALDETLSLCLLQSQSDPLLLRSKQCATLTSIYQLNDVHNLFLNEKTKKNASEALKRLIDNLQLDQKASESGKPPSTKRKRK